LDRTEAEQGTRIAAIDIGSNTILLLVADVGEDGRVHPVREVERTTRLGRGLAKTGHLHPEALKESLGVIDDYLAMSKVLGVDRILIVGTSALRQADNAGDLVDSVEHLYGLEIRIISGLEEARLSFLAVDKEMGRGAPILVIDIGGGSVEFVLGEGGRISHLESLHLGAVALTETFLLSNPVSQEEFRQMTDHIASNLRRLTFTPPEDVVCLGGTATTLAAVRVGARGFDPSLLHGSLLSYREVARQVSLYRMMTREGRLGIPGLPEERADIILAGAAILLEAMRFLGFASFKVSCHGLRYGLVYAILQGH